MGNRAPNFKITVQFVDDGGNGGVGPAQSTGYVRDGDSETDYVGDSDFWDPDGVLLALSIRPDEDGELDFRVGIQAADKNVLGEWSYGETRWTSWASNGGGWTGMASDQDDYNPDAYRVRLETREWPKDNDRVLQDVRLGVRLYDNGIPASNDRFTEWASKGGGTAFVVDADARDFDGMSLKIDTDFE